MFFESPKLVKKTAKHHAEKHGLEYVVRNPYGNLVYDKKGKLMFFKTEKAAKTYALLLDDKK